MSRAKPGFESQWKHEVIEELKAIDPMENGQAMLDREVYYPKTIVFNLK